MPALIASQLSCLPAYNYRVRRVLMLYRDSLPFPIEASHYTLSPDIVLE